MPEIRFEYVSPKQGGAGFVTDVFNFIGSPATASFFGLLGKKSTGSGPFFTVELDLETGLISILPDVGFAASLAKAPRGVSGILAGDKRDLDKIEASLQDAYETGDLSDVPKRYLEVGKQLVEIRRSEKRDEPNVPAPPYGPPPPSQSGRVGAAPRPGTDSGDRFVPPVALQPTTFAFDPYNPYYAPQVSGGGVPVVVPTIPPGGFAGFAQQTVAAQRALTKGVRNLVRRRRSSKKRSAAPRRRRAARSNGKKARLVKGSAAAKRHMAKLRRMRK